MNRNFYFKKVCVFGLGLIGGSLCRDLRAKGLAKTIVGFDVRKENLKYACKNRIISRAGKNFQEEFADCDLLILAAPVQAIQSLMAQLSPYVSRRCLVVDAGSTKTEIISTADRCFPRGNFVGTHPMAGKELSGIRFSQSGLFAGNPCLIVAGKRTGISSRKKAARLWQTIGACPVNIPVSRHDRDVALVSHLPHVLAYALMSLAGKKNKSGSPSRVGGNSFKDYTRVAASDAAMWRNIFLDNRRHVVSAIKQFESELKHLAGLIRSNNGRGLFRYLKRISAMRCGL